jgi:hypothetical protein
MLWTRIGRVNGYFYGPYRGRARLCSCLFRRTAIALTSRIGFVYEVVHNLGRCDDLQNTHTGASRGPRILGHSPQYLGDRLRRDQALEWLLNVRFGGASRHGPSARRCRLLTQSGPQPQSVRKGAQRRLFTLSECRQAKPEQLQAPASR